MIAEEIRALLVELEKPRTQERARMCMICASCEHVFRCSRCHTAFYCGPSCQQSHWRLGHKRDCKKAPLPLPPIDDS